MELPLQEMRALHKLDVVFKCIQDLWLMPALQTQDSFRGTSILSLRKADVSARFELYIKHPQSDAKKVKSNLEIVINYKFI